MSELLQQYIQNVISKSYLWTALTQGWTWGSWTNQVTQYPRQRTSLFFIPSSPFFLHFLNPFIYNCCSTAHSSYCLGTQVCIWGAYSTLVTQQLKSLEQNLFYNKHSSTKIFPQTWDIFYSFFWLCYNILIKFNQSLSVGTEFQPLSITISTWHSHKYWITLNLSSLGFQIHTQILDNGASHNSQHKHKHMHLEKQPPQT